MKNKMKRRSFWGGLLASVGCLFVWPLESFPSETEEPEEPDEPEEEWENSFVFLRGGFDASGWSNCTGLCGVKIVRKYSPEPDLYKTHRAELPPWQFHRFAIELDDEQSDAFVRAMERWMKTRKKNLEMKNDE